MFTQRYLDDLMARMTYNSNAIENNTLTLNETISIVLYKTTPNGKDLREVYEAVNHAEAVNLMMNKIDNHEEMNYKTILDLHYVLMDKLDMNRGQFKSNVNMIVGADFETASPAQVPYLIDNWCHDLNKKLTHTNDPIVINEIVAEKHIEFERIHPFNDGNGRLGRLLMNYTLIQQGLPPFVVPKENKLQYINYLSEQNTSRLSKMIHEQCLLEKERAIKFGVNLD